MQNLNLFLSPTMYYMNVLGRIRNAGLYYLIQEESQSDQHQAAT